MRASTPIPFKRLGLLGTAAALACALPVLAQNIDKFGARDASRVSAGNYTVDSHHTLVRWQIDHLGITPYFGIFGDVTGSMTLDPKNPAAAKVDITIPVSKVTTASAGLTSHLLKAPASPSGKPDFFGPSPADARFVSTAVVPDKDDPGEAKIIGNLTLNGITRPVTLDVEFHGAGKMPEAMGGKENVGFEAQATIRRSEFGMTFGLPGLSDEVKLDIVAAFAK